MIMEGRRASPGGEPDGDGVYVNSCCFSFFSFGGTGSSASASASAYFVYFPDGFSFFRV